MSDYESFRTTDVLRRLGLLPKPSPMEKLAEQLRAAIAGKVVSGVRCDFGSTVLDFADGSSVEFFPANNGAEIGATVRLCSPPKKGSPS